MRVEMRCAKGQGGLDAAGSARSASVAGFVQGEG